MAKQVEEWGEDSTGIRMLGAALAGAKEVRKANVNRAEHGLKELSLPGMAVILTWPAKAMERAYADALMDEYERFVPSDVQKWFRGIPGFGDGVLSARLIGYIGNPCVATPMEWSENGKELVVYEDEDRTISQLWAYCGCGDPALSACHGYRTTTRDQKLAVGKRSTARAVLYSWSSYLVRMAGRSADVANSKYYKLYITTRKDAAGHDGKCDTGKWPSPCAGTHKHHNSDCQNKNRPPLAPNGCGIAAHREWGQVGSPWRPGHLNMHAHRIVHKELLRDLWVTSG
jgi:hypothetical protein